MTHPDSVDLPVAARRRPLSKMRWGLAIVASTSMIFGMASVSGAAPAVHQTVDVIRIDGQANEGSATLTRTNSGISMKMSSTVGGGMFDLPFNPPPAPSVGDWEVGDATTNWFVVFSNPDGCTDPCGEDDVIAGLPPFNGGPAQVSIHYAAGHVAGSPAWHSAGSLREGDTSGMLFGVPLQDAMTAEVHIITRSHGQMTTLLPGERGYALNSVDGGCETNVCGDAQAAIFAPPS